MLFLCLIAPSLRGLSSRFSHCLCLLTSTIIHGFLSVLLSVLLSIFIANVPQGELRYWILESEMALKIRLLIIEF